MQGLLERAHSLATSASVLKIASDLVFLLLVLALVTGTAGDDPDPPTVGWTTMGVALAIAVPLILVAGEALPGLVARAFGERLLANVLPTFALLQLPAGLLVFFMDGIKRGLGRAFGLREGSETERRILADLRKVVEDSPMVGDLDATEREIIENVMEFRDVDAAEIMTPRTEISAVEASVSVEDAARIVAECGHSRVPVYRDSLDRIVGFITARDLLQLRSRGELDSAHLEAVLRPAYFVPETKRVSELLSEFRREHSKMAVVLDEYGGTAGIVTMGDILEELVGDIPDEYDDHEPEPVRTIEPGVFEIDASLRVSEVNEELHLGIPEEEDFETLGGFVLAELGRFPKKGESFTWGDSEFAIVDANDRRVLTLRVRSLVREISE